MNIPSNIAVASPSAGAVQIVAPGQLTRRALRTERDSLLRSYKLERWMYQVGVVSEEGAGCKPSKIES